jgi:hypothetical protein
MPIAHPDPNLADYENYYLLSFRILAARFRDLFIPGGHNFREGYVTEENI